MPIGIFGQYDEDEDDAPKFDPMNPYGSPLAPKPPVDPTQPPMQQGPRPYQGPPTQPWWQQKQFQQTPQPIPKQPPPQPPQQPQPFNPEVPMAKGGPLPAAPPPTQAGPPGVVPDDNLKLPYDQRKPVPIMGTPITEEESNRPAYRSNQPSPLPPHNPMSNRPTGMGTPPKEGEEPKIVATLMSNPPQYKWSDGSVTDNPFKPGSFEEDEAINKAKNLEERKKAFETRKGGGPQPDNQMSISNRPEEMAKRGIAPAGPINPVQPQRPAMGPPPGYINKEQREQAEKDKIIDYMKKHEASGKTDWDAGYEKYLRRGWGKGGIHPLARGLTFEEPYDKNASYAKNWDPSRDRDMNGKSFIPRAEGMVSSSVPATTWSDGKLTISDEYNSPHITMKEVAAEEQKRRAAWEAREGKSPLNKDVSSRGDRDIDRPLPQGSKGFMLASDMKEAQSKGITPPPFNRRPGQVIEDPSKGVEGMTKSLADIDPRSTKIWNRKMQRYLNPEEARQWRIDHGEEP